MSAETVRLLWERMEARDWDGVADQLHPDVVVDWPNTAERMRGRDNFLAVQQAFGEGWHVQVLRIVDGKIVRAVEYWSDGEPQPAPEWRASWTEPL